MWNVQIHNGTQNVHNVHRYNIGIPKHKKHLRLLSSGTKLFITFELKGFSTWGERYTWLFHLPQTMCAPATRPRRASESQLSSSEAGIKLQTFLKSQPTLPVRDVTHIPGLIHYLGFLLWHLWMTRPLRACVNTCAHVCTLLTHALSRKVLSLTKPKDKIYKTKSLGHYITYT